MAGGGAKQMWRCRLVTAVVHVEGKAGREGGGEWR